MREYCTLFTFYSFQLSLGTYLTEVQHFAEYNRQFQEGSLQLGWKGWRDRDGSRYPNPIQYPNRNGTYWRHSLYFCLTPTESLWGLLTLSSFGIVPLPWKFIQGLTNALTGIYCIHKRLRPLCSRCQCLDPVKTWISCNLTLYLVGLSLKNWQRQAWWSDT